MILDAGFLISIDRGERSAREFLTASLRHGTPLSTTHPVVAQVWRDGARQARLARFLATLMVHPFDDGAAVGQILARSLTSDVVDAHLVAVALRLSEPILTGDVTDFERLAASLPDHRPRVFGWP
ncbi:MAG: PIN domain nuclease [Actinomycetota bacterium]|nr:PIN domain nuclease [Actinomycetota bacterium]